MSQFDDQSDAPDAIANAVEIRGLLKRLAEQRSLLSVQVEGLKGGATSALLSLDIPEGYLTLDELVPNKAHQVVRVGTRLAIQTRVDRVDVRFVLEIAGLGRSEGIGLYYARIPRWIRYKQQRGAFRARVGMGKIVPAYVSTELSNGFVQGTLVDLSVTGFGANLPKSAPVEVGDDCDLRLTFGTKSIEAHGFITFARLPEGARERRIGGRFIGIEPSLQRLLATVVADLQREQLRRLQEL